MGQIARIPDDFTVWAFTDVHGVHSALSAALGVAGIIDAAGHWSAPPKTALVGCGDYIDRGTDSAGVLDLLFRLRTEAAAQDGMVVLCRGNHEAMLLDTLNGISESFKVWITEYAGGLESLGSFGIQRTDPDLHLGVSHLAAALRELRPELAGRLASMPDAAIWRDVLFCHAGPVPGAHPDQFGTWTNEHLWQTPNFDLVHNDYWNLAGHRYQGYRQRGIGRFVFGHMAHAEERLYQGGKALDLDTNACGGAFGVRDSTLTIARIPTTGTLGAADFVTIDTRSAPDRCSPRTRRGVSSS